MLVSIKLTNPCCNESDIFPINVCEKLPTIFVNLDNSLDKSKLKLSVSDAILKKFFIAVSVLSKNRALLGSAAITVNPVVDDIDVTSGSATF